MKQKTLSVSAIKTGTVIDHITAGQALKIVRLLRLNEEERQVTIGLNLKSDSMGLKDIIKVEDLHLTAVLASQIAVFAPKATVNIIENYKVSQKFPVSIPSSIQGLLLCPNLTCITRGERLPAHFTVEQSNGHFHLRCRHCEQIFSQRDL